LPIVLYGCETCSFTLREVYGFRVYENRVLRKIFEPKSEVEVAGSWRKLHYEEIHKLYSSPHIIMVDQQGG